MGCASCSTGGCGVKTVDGKSASGCKGEGSCGCNKKNTYDWLSDIELPEYNAFDVVEVSFKNGARKGFYVNQGFSRAETGDNVVVEAGTGYDVGTITLSGELVRLQMKKKKVSTTAVLPNIIRRCNERDFEKLQDARSLEQQTMVRARVIARSLKLDMKIGDVEYQGDRRKATFYYTADGRVDFRELIKLFAKEFKVKIEMRQIGARQESARIGGLGSCGRELCCSTWLTDFKSVSTAAARYQNLAINQSKLSGQCGRLKCCLNYELDSYMDALTDFPKKADVLLTEAGKATLVKTDIFKRTMYYVYRGSKNNKFYPLDVERVKTILAMNANGKKPIELMPTGYETMIDAIEEPDYKAVNDVLELAPLEKRKRKRSRNRKRSRGETPQRNTVKGIDKPTTQQEAKPTAKISKTNTKTTKSNRGTKSNKSTDRPATKPISKQKTRPQKAKKTATKPPQQQVNKPVADKQNTNPQEGQQPKSDKPKSKFKRRRRPKRTNDKPKVNPQAPQPKNQEGQSTENPTEKKNFKRRRRNRNRNRNRNNDTSKGE